MVWKKCDRSTLNIQGWVERSKTYFIPTSESKTGTSETPQSTSLTPRCTKEMKTGILPIFDIPSINENQEDLWLGFVPQQPTSINY